MTTPFARIMARTTVSSDGCWNVGSVRRYAQVRVGGRTGPVFKAHRVVYETLIGPIQAGLDIDHLCRNRSCCNPEHLEPVTRRINTLRGASPVAANAKKTECKNGHPFDAENTYVSGDHRVCRACNREAVRRYKQRLRILR